MYLTWSKKTISDFSDSNINSLYNEGYLFTRTGKGEMYQTRSLRIDLSRFKLTSENRRILKKTENLLVTSYELPVTNYNWRIGKMAKDFYETKFGKGVFSANKIKELLTTRHNFNRLFVFVIPNPKGEGSLAVAYAICLETKELLHYSYPFYNLEPISYKLIPNLGLGMMLRAILWAQENGKKYVYLGSAQRPTDTYKLQFEEMEWFNDNGWENDIEELKKIL